MNRANYTTILLFSLLAGCGIFGDGDQAGGDTQFGDDGADEVGADGGVPDPLIVDDHQNAQYCVDRWAAVAAKWPNDTVFAAQHEAVSTHERWDFLPVIDSNAVEQFQKKPYPKEVLDMFVVGDVISNGEMTPYAANVMTTSGLVGGYHVPLPDLGLTNHEGTDIVFPWERTLLVDFLSMGFPAEAGTFSWLAEPCCEQPMTMERATAYGFPLGVPIIISDTHGDCKAHSYAKGAHNNAAGYFWYADDTPKERALESVATCVTTKAAFDPVFTAPIAVFKSKGISTTNNNDTEWTQFWRTGWPWNLNFDWYGDWVNIDWEQFDPNLPALPQLILALYDLIYLPPEDFLYPRFGGGGGCAYNAVITRMPDDVVSGGIRAVSTCPNGYYGSPDTIPIEYFDTGDTYAMHCVMEGLDSALVPPDLEDAAAITPFEHPSGNRWFAVNDAGEFAEVLAGSKTVSTELAALLGDGSLEGAVIEWWSSPWDEDPEPIDEAMVHTVVGDQAALADLLGGSERAREVMASYGAEHLGVIEPSLVGTVYEDRMVYTFEGHNTWRLRLNTGDGFVRFLYFTARPE